MKARRNFFSKRTALLMTVLTLLSATVVGGFLWFNNPGEAEAANTATVKLSEQSVGNGGEIDAINRSYGKGWWTFTLSSKPTGTPSVVFCLNSTKSMHTGDKLTYETSSASSFSNKSLARAMTWYFGTLGGGSYSGLSATTTKYVVQVYCWAVSTDGADVTKAVKEALSNMEASTSYASSIISAISNTAPYGTIYYYTKSSCAASSTSGHQHLIGWTSATPEPVEPEVNKTSATVSDYPTETITITINKQDYDTSSLIDTAKFLVTYRGYNVASAASNLSDVVSISFDVTTGTRSGSTFTTSGGKIVVKITVKYKLITATSGEYKYVTNWNQLSASQQNTYAKNGYYDSKAKAQAAADKEAQQRWDDAASAYLNASHVWTVTETSAPEHHVLATTTTQSWTESSSTISHTFTFEDKEGYFGVKITKSIDTSTSQYKTSAATLAGAEYTIYAGEDILDTANNKTLYAKDSKVCTITTDETGVASSGNVLPIGYSYYIKETKAAPGFALNDGTYTFTSSTNKATVSLTTSKTDILKESYAYAYVDLYKYYETYTVGNTTMQTIAEKNATFEIYDASGNKVATMVTDSNGYAKAGPFAYGKYTVKQTSGNNYTKLLTFTFSVTNQKGSTIHLSTQSSPKVNTFTTYGKIKIYKEYQTEEYDSGTGTYTYSYSPETSAVFEVRDSSGTVWDTIYLTSTATLANGRTYAYGTSVELPANLTYTLVQIAGETDVKWTTDNTVTFSYTKNASSKKVVTKTFTLDNLLPYPFVQVYKDTQILTEDGEFITDSSTDGFPAEEGAEFTVISAYYDDTTDTYTVPGSGGTGTMTLEELNAMSYAERSAYVDSLPADMIAAVLTTDAAGSDMQRLGDRTENTATTDYYVIVQTDGLSGYSLAEPEGFVAEAGTTATFYFQYTNVKYQAEVSLTKNRTYMLEDGSEYTTEVEPDAVFYVLRAEQLGMTASELAAKLNAMTEAERVAYLDSLDATSIGGETDVIGAILTTDENGEAYAVIDCAESTEEFVLVQYSGTTNYILADAEPFVYKYSAGEEEEEEVEATAAVGVFAVYSADDGSLTFYNREMDVEEGEIYNGKTATAVYTGFDTETYTAASSVPWYTYRTRIGTVVVADEGIAPVSLAYWFYGFTQCSSMVLTGLDVSGVTSMNYTFYSCVRLTMLDLSSFELPVTATLQSTFANCSNLVTIYVGDGWRRTESGLGLAISSAGTFTNCSSLVGGNGSTVASVTAGSTLAAAATMAVTSDYAWADTEDVVGYLTYHSEEEYATSEDHIFAVYSADDGSLIFYNRAISVSAGDVYNGRTVTAVYEGFDLVVYENAVDAPWGADKYQTYITSVTVADEGIAPISTAYWFYGFTNCLVMDLEKLDVSETASMRSMFRDCSSLTVLDLQSFDTSSVINTDYMFYGDSALETIYVSDLWDMSSVTNGSSMFTNCTSLVGDYGSSIATVTAAGVDSTTAVSVTYAVADSYDTQGYLTNPSAQKVTTGMQ